MTNIKIYCDENGNIMKFECKNHSGFAEYGKDIVCAGISSITQTAVLGIKNIVKIKHKCVIDEKLGFLSFELLENENSSLFHDAQVVLNTMLCGLSDLEKNYSKFLKI